MVGVKSVLLGIHSWLPDAMEGPTSVSAVIHAATLVVAGVLYTCKMSVALWSPVQLLHRCYAYSSVLYASHYCMLLFLQYVMQYKYS